MASAKTSVGLSEQKWLNMQAGVVLLRGWLEDQLTYGLSVWETDPSGHLERIAAQLTDAQLGGPAGAFRRLAARVGTGDWAAEALDELGYWHLQCKLFQRAEHLSEQQLAGLALNFGHHLRKAALPELGARVSDRWTCTGVELGVEGSLYYRRTYWTGRRKPHSGVQLEFNYGRELPASQLEVGTSGEFEMLVYPDGLPGRLVLPEGVRVGDSQAPPFAHEDWAAQRTAQREVLGLQPWRREFELAVQGVRARLVGEAIWVVDRGGGAVRLPLGGPLPEQRRRARGTYSPWPAEPR